MATLKYESDIVINGTISKVNGLGTEFLKANGTLDSNNYELFFSKNSAFNKNFGTGIGTVAEGNDSRILNGQTAFNWGNHEGKYPLYNGTGANGTWGINISGNSSSSQTLYTNDIRSIAPVNGPSSKLTYGFTTWNNNNSSPYADYLHLRSYNDTSGGNDNLVTFNKSTIGMRIWQQTFGSATAYSTYKDVAFTDGSNSIGTWGINISGSAANSTLWNGINYDGAFQDQPISYILSRDGFSDTYKRTSAANIRSWLGLGSNAYNSTDYFKYETFTADANTLPGNRSAFTYALNAPNNGPIAHFAANGYGMQMNMSYGNNGNNISLRSRNGDGSFWNPWKNLWHDGNFNPASYLSLSGGTLNGNILFSDSGTTKRGIQGRNAGNDFWFVGGGATSNESGYLEIATGDDGQTAGNSEPIYVSQYGPGDPLTGTLFRRATLLDNYGNTSFPGSVSTAGLIRGNSRIIATGGWGSAYHTADLEVMSGRAGGPVISLHWSGTVASTIGLETSGRIAIRNNPGTGYEDLIARNMFAESFNGAGTGLTGTAAGFNIGGSSNYLKTTPPTDNADTIFSNTPVDTMSWRDAYNVTNGAGSSWVNYLNMRHGNASNIWGTQLAMSWEAGDFMKYRSVYNGAFTPWKTVIDSGNIGSQSVNYSTYSGYITNGAGSISNADGWHRLQTVSGYIAFGPANSSHAHIYTDRDSFYFNRDILINGAAVINSSTIGSQSVSYANSSAYLNKQATANLRLVTSSGIYREEQPDSGYSYTTTLNMNSDDGRQQLTIERGGNGMKFRGSTSGSGDIAWSGWRNVIHDNNYGSYVVPISGGTFTGVVGAASLGVTQNGGAGAGISLYGGAGTGKPSYGMMFATTANYGTHGSVSGDWATYFTMDGAANRGWVFRLTNTNVTSISATGTISTAGDVIAYSSSDRRLKDNIQKISNPIEKILRIGGYTFDWNNKQSTYTGHDVGVVADEIEAILPELVTTRDSGYKAVKYDKLVALLIEGMKEQQLIIVEQDIKISKILNHLNIN